MQELKFCQRCGFHLTIKNIDHRERPFCVRCNTPVFLDPKVAVVVLIVKDGKLVLVRRDIQPFMGHWAFPSGYVDRSARVEDEAVREVKEETGLDVNLKSLLGVYSEHGNPVVLVAYTAEIVGGSLQALDEVQEVSMFPLNQLPPLPFPHDGQIISDFFLRGAGPKLALDFSEDW